MLETLHDIGHFVVGVLSHWQGYVTGGLVTALIGLIERLTGRQMSKKAYSYVFIGLFLLVSFFVTWQEEYKRAEGLQAQLNSKPLASPFQINVPTQPASQIQVTMPQSSTTQPVKPFISSDTKELLAPIFSSQGLPTTEVYITAHGIVSNPTFELICDNECGYETTQSMSTGTLPEAKQISPTTLQVRFIVPAQLTDGQQVSIRVRSNTKEPIHKIGVKRIEK